MEKSIIRSFLDWVYSRYKLKMLILGSLWLAFFVLGLVINKGEPILSVLFLIIIISLGVYFGVHFVVGFQLKNSFFSEKLLDFFEVFFLACFVLGFITFLPTMFTNPDETALSSCVDLSGLMALARLHQKRK